MTDAIRSTWLTDGTHPALQGRAKVGRSPEAKQFQADRGTTTDQQEAPAKALMEKGDA